MGPLLLDLAVDASTGRLLLNVGYTTELLFWLSKYPEGTNHRSDLIGLFHLVWGHWTTLLHTLSYHGCLEQLWTISNIWDFSECLAILPDLCSLKASSLEHHHNITGTNETNSLSFIVGCGDILVQTPAM